MESRMVLAVLLALVPARMYAQQLQPVVAPENQPTDETPLSVPVTLNGQSGTLAFQSETPTESFVSGGIGFVGSYTDDALLTSTDKLDNFSYQLQPHINWSEMTPRLELKLSLNGGVIFNNNLGAQNQAEEGVNLDAAWRLTQHVSFRLNDVFANTTGMFSSFGTSPEATGVGVVEQSNSSLLVPPAQRTVSNQSLAEFTDQVGRTASSVFGVRIRCLTTPIHHRVRNSESSMTRVTTRPRPFMTGSLPTGSGLE